MRKIAVIIPYFGVWPKWFELYLYSCSFQKGLIDFYYFTDCGVPELTYENTFFFELSFEEYCSLVSEKLSINFQPDNKYKLTDLKPFLGAVHSEISRKYQFWAFADIDLVYGDMSLFLTSKRLSRYDLLTTHSDRIAGHFTAIRTGSKFDNPFAIDNWKKRLESQENCNLDEGAFTDCTYPMLRLPSRICRILGNWGLKNARKVCSVFGLLFCNPLSRRLFREENTTPIPIMEDKYVFDNGKVHKNGIQIPYLHFLFFKKTPYLETDKYWDAEIFYKVKDIHKPVSISLSGISNQSSL